MNRSAWRNSIRDVVFKSFLVALFAFGADWLTEAFLESDVLRHMAARMFLPYDAFLHGLGAKDAERDRIVIVDVGTPTLARYRTSWPISYGQHARILERMRRARPRALLVDFQFQSTRDDPSLGALLRSLCAFQADGIPVFLAADANPERPALRPELLALRGADGRTCFDPVAVGYEPDNADRNVWSYALNIRRSSQPLRSAALAMAEATLGRKIELGGGDTTMGLVWGSGREPLGPSWRAATKGGDADLGTHGEPGSDAAAPSTPATEPERHYCRAASAWDLLPFVAAFRDTRPNCPMHRAIEAATLTVPRTADENAALDARIADRAVFYGGSFDANEFVNSPLHGELPGVYLHAQATDNLLRFGDRWRRPEIFGALDRQWEHPMAFMSFWVVALVLMSSHRLLQRLRFRIPRRGWWSSRARRVRRRVPSWLVLIAVELFEHARSLLGRLVLFYAMLVIAMPLALVLEYGFRVSVIGYSSILGFCLLGDAFTESRKMSTGVAHAGGHRPAG